MLLDNKGRGIPTRPNQLDQLPSELLLKILPQLPDLASLDSVIRASPTCYRVFDSYAVEITEAVLNCGGVRKGKYTTTGYTCGHTRVLVCVIARVRSSTLPIHSLRELEVRVVKEALHYRSRIRPSLAGFAPEHLREDTEPAVIRSILATARRLTWCALDCIEFYLARFRALRPDVLPGKEFDSYTKRRTPQGVKFEGRRDIGPPSWLEEQRAARAFWRLQLLVDLQYAAKSLRLHKWPAPDIEALRNESPEDFYGWQKHTVLYYGYAEPEYQEIITVMEYVRQRHGVGQDWWPPAAALRSVEVSRKWPTPAPMEEDWRKIVKPSGAVAFHVYAYHNPWPIRHEQAPLKGTVFELFRRYGFAFWSNERMAAYGLPVDRGHSMGWHHAWQSILNQEEMDMIE